MNNLLSTRQSSKRNLESVLQLLDKAVALQSDNSNILFARSIVKLNLKLLKSAFEDISTAIDKADRQYSIHYLTRASINISNYDAQNALKDLNQALNCEQKPCPQTFLGLARCYCMIGEKQDAISCLNKYVELSSNKNNIHEYTGNLLFLLGAHQEAVKAYSYIPKLNIKPALLLKRAMCLVAQKELFNAIREFKQLWQVHRDLPSKSDLVCLQVLKSISQDSQKASLQKIKLKDLPEGHVFKESDIKFYQGLVYLIAKHPASAQTFIEAMQLKLSEEDESFETLIFQNRAYCQAQLFYALYLSFLSVNNHAKADNYFSRMEAKLNKLKLPPRKPSEPWSPFPVQGRLCSIFKPLNLDGQLYQLSFCLPRIQTQEYNDLKQILLNQLSLRTVSNRPDAPWIQRNTFGVVFTQDILQEQVQLNSEQSQKPSEMSIRSQPQSIIKREQVREMLKLDEAVQEKIARLINK